MLRMRVKPQAEEAYAVDLPGASSAGEVLVGRSTDADVALDDRYLSRRHARFFLRDGQWWIEDLGSRNGTLLNGRRLNDPQPVHPGDSIRISETQLLIENARTGGTISDAAHSIFRPASELLLSTRGDVSELGSEDRLRILNEVHRALALSIERDELLQMILERVFDLLQPSEGAILLLDESGEHYRAAHRSVAEVDTHFWSETLADEVIHKGMAALVTDVEHDRRFAAAESILSSGVRTLVAAPLTDGEGTFGMIALTSETRGPFVEADMELLASLGNVAALRIRNIRLTEEAIKRRELERELELAREIQVGLLPDELPQVDGYELLGRNYPSRGVSGDYYYAADYGDRLVLMVADVSGKGISASLLTASLEALAAAPLESSGEPATICTELSLRLYARTPAAKYATSFLAIVDPKSGEIVYVNAGHTFGLLVRGSSGVECLEVGGLPLGLMPTAEYETGRIRIEPGDTLALYTDGITEAVNDTDDEYGERLHRVLADHRGKPLPELADAIEEDVGAFVGQCSFNDDRTLVLLRRANR